ncbi:DENN domain protein [Ancylostoma duodenale]|uniref:DENN domain protein n=1 Tax=Ancylostoma duodenale TaxID=51022 RepID=A0A0C2HBV6_9BILA|nr:DENN domain protein [Ancylostoma duodenale]
MTCEFLVLDEDRMSVSEVERQCTPRLADYFVELQLDETQIRHGSSVGVVTRRLPSIEWPDVPFPNSISMMYEPCVGSLDEDCEDSYQPSASMYRPRVYVILSRYPYFDLFRLNPVGCSFCLKACLHRIFLAIQNDVSTAEVMIATIISKILLVGRSPISFTMGGERVSVQPILQRRVPLTGDRVARFARCLGSIHNLLTVVRAVLCDAKIILHSSSQQRLSDSAYAIKSIIFPFEYTYTFVTALPELLLEYLESPTPYLMGVLSQVRGKLPNVDAVVVDLDTGEVRLPLNSQLAELPSPFRERLITRLQRDKEIRACFVLFFSELLYGYRSCLELVRLHRHPLIVFHKAAFMGMRHLSSPLLHDLIEGQMFQLFVATRGLPFRECDIFDDVVCTATVDNDDLDASEEKQRLSKISNSLLVNEKQECIMTTTPTLAKRASLAISNGDHLNHDESTLRPLNNERINALIEQNRSHWCLDDPGRLHPKEVPVPAKLNLYEEHIGANSRRLLVLSACVDAIFDNRMSEARKMMCAVELSLRVVAARVALCRHLASAAVPVTRAMLQPAQFELVVRLLNCALERLTQGVQQYAYTCVQDHSVWSNQRFWEAAFFHDVHELMRRHYGNAHDSDMPLSGKSRYDMWNLLEEPTAMAISAARLSNLSEYSEEELKKCSEEEESIVYGQAKHYVNLMIYLRVPLDASRLRRIDKNDLELRGNSRGLRDTDSFSCSDGESGFIENVNDGDLGNVVVTWISRVIDRICSAAGLDPRLTEQLTQVIPGFVAVHIDNLEQVYAESRKLAPPPKPKLLTPVLLTPCERIVVGGLRCVLLPEGRPVSAENPENNVNLLPAEGALFLTNYRIIFKGRPTNPFLTDVVVVRSVPVMTLTKEKSIGDQSLHAAGQLHGISSKIASGLHDGLQMRTSCFQLLKVAFDEEVSGDEVEAFTKSLSSQRWPSVLPHTLFAYNTVSHLLTSTLPTGSKSKYSTIRELKKTIARFPGKNSMARRRLDSVGKWPQSPLVTSAMRSSTQPAKNDTFANHSDYLDLSDIPEIINPLNGPDMHRHHLCDYERLRLRGIDSIFRISYANAHYDIIKSYPCAFVVPSSVGDDAFLKIAKGFKHGRFPVITWTSESGALLIRGSGLTQSNVVQKIKKANILHGSESVSTLGGSRMTLVSKDSGDAGPLHSAEYQEHYLARLAQVSPSGSGDMGGTTGSLTSLLSIDSLLTADGMSVATGTPDARRRNQGSDFGRHYATSIRSSGGKPGSRGSMINPTIPWTVASSYSERQSQKTLQHAIGSLSRKNLYILVEKGHSKIFRGDKNVEFVPISFPTTHQMKVSFKKLLRVMRPSVPFMDSSSSTFYRSLEESEWLQMVALCIEEGWDATCQLMSLAQLMLDPYYRTIDGFQVLIEKEWLAFGHRFSHRANHTISSQNSGITPVFLLMAQFPGAFEINDFYLRFLAYHSQSAFFRTFLLDCESERVQLEQLVPETGEGHRGCIWLYIKEKTSRNTIFHNLLYSPDGQGVLLPACSVAALQIWTFYSEETLSHGSPYDIDLAEAELAERDEEQFAHSGEGVTTGNAAARIIDSTVTSQDLRREDGITFLVQTNDRLNPLDKPRVGGWLATWQTAEERILVKDEEDQDEKEEKPRDWDWQVRRVLMKRAALRLLLRGVTSRSAASQKTVARNHVFEHYGASGAQPSECALCHFPLYGTVVRTGQRCRQCGVIAHDKCIVNITWPCDARGTVAPRPIPEQSLPPTPVKSTAEQQNTVVRSETMLSDFGEANGGRTLTMGHGVVSSSRAAPLHQGYLSKKGAKFKLWAPRWFELEANSHKMYYYESEHDMECRGYIDLCDVGSVEVENSGSKAILELRTKKRIYSLLAESRLVAETWKEKIEMVLRE